MFNPPDIDNIEGEGVTTPATILILDDVFSNSGGRGLYKTTKTGQNRRT